MLSFLVAAALPFVEDAAAQGAPSQSAPPLGDTLVVAVKEAPPFVVRRSGGGEWTGLSIELWKAVADELERPYVFRQAPLAAMIDSVAAGRYDAALAALTMTSEREQRVDFSYPYVTAGQGVAVRAEEPGGWVEALGRLLSPAFLGVVLTLAALLFVVGALVWFFERRKNPDHFGGTAGEGLGAGFWWSAVTMTTVGYGDKAPSTVGGRLVALVWMFAALIIASSFTAAITTALTTTHLDETVQTGADLSEVSLATVGGTRGARYLEDQRFGFESFSTPEEALGALREGQVEAVVYDLPILRALASDSTSGTVEVLPRTLTREFYGIALPEDSPRREPINRALLRTLDTPAWQDARYRYLGER